MPRLWIVVCCLAVIACDKKSPEPPVVDPTPAPEAVTGSERIGWDQPAADAAELAAIGYVVYVDGARTALSSVTCAGAPGGAGFPCTARLPSLTAGAHTLELASFVTDGGVLESARSAPLRVTMAALTQGAPAGGAAGAVLRDAGAQHAEIVADGLESPIDIAFAPDGRLFVAERAGRIRIIRPPSASARQGRLLAEPAIALADTLGAGVHLLSIAIDPHFERTRHIFAIYAAPSRSGDSMFSLARFREVSGTLGDRAVLLDGVTAAAPSASAALRFGPDGKLYAAFDDGGDARRRGDPGALNGKVLRLNTDGTTPGDSGGLTPIYGRRLRIAGGDRLGSTDRDALGRGSCRRRIGVRLLPGWALSGVERPPAHRGGAVRRQHCVDRRSRRRRARRRDLLRHRHRDWPADAGTRAVGFRRAGAAVGHDERPVALRAHLDPM